MLLHEFSEAVGVSGKEDAVRKIILNAIDSYGYADDIQFVPTGDPVKALRFAYGVCNLAP